MPGWIISPVLGQRPLSALRMSTLSTHSSNARLYLSLVFRQKATVSAKDVDGQTSQFWCHAVLSVRYLGYSATHRQFILQIRLDRSRPARVNGGHQCRGGMNRPWLKSFFFEGPGRFDPTVMHALIFFLLIYVILFYFIHKQKEKKSRTTTVTTSRILHPHRNIQKYW